MIAPAHMTSTIEAAIRYELCNSSLEAIAVASVIEPRELANRMGVDVETARLIRKAAKNHIRELWAFEEAAYKRK